MTKDSREMKLLVRCVIWCALLIAAWARTSWPIFTIAVLLILRVELLEHEYGAMVAILDDVKDDMDVALDLLESGRETTRPIQKDNILWLVKNSAQTPN